MGNVFGCVRGPKEECYVDPKKAPLGSELKDRKGRRYFQRKRRKLDISLAVEALDSPGCEAVTSEAGSLENDPGGMEESRPGMEVETHLSSQGSLSRGVCVGEQPVSLLRHSCHQPHKRLTQEISSDSDRGGCTVAKTLISTTPRVAPAGDGLPVKLTGPQLRRAVSFGAAEQTPSTLRVNDGSANEETFAKIIWSSQANMGLRPRASSFSGYIQHYLVSAKCASTDHKVNL